MPQTLWFFIAFVIVLALIGVAAWLVRRFGGSSLGGSGASRGGLAPRAAVRGDGGGGRGRVRAGRDNVEPLLMIGAPADLVVEPNIVRSMPQRDQAAPRGPVGTELPPRLAPDAGWSDSEAPHADTFEHREPLAPESPPRPVRAPHFDDTRRPAAPLPERHSPDVMPSFTPEPMIRPEPSLRPEPMLRSEPRAIPRSERSEPLPPRLPRSGDAPKAPPLPPRPPARPAADPSLSSADQNLADMAQRLEAALRRPGGEPRLDTAPSIGPVERPGAPPVAPEPMGNRPAPRSEGAPRPPVPPAPPPPPTPKAAFENLEDEMANLLGRPKPPA